MENVTGNTGIRDGGANNTLGIPGSQNMVEVMYFHGTTIDGNRYTISGVVEDDDLLLGIAVCADGEQFSKEKGRTISSGRVLNQRKSPVGRNRKSFYALPSDSRFRVDESGGFVKDYYKGIEIKVFRDVVCKYNYYTKRELMDEFGLFKRTYLPVI